MKFLKILTLTFFVVFAGYGISKAQNGPGHYASVRICETNISADSQIIITYEDLSTEVIKLPVMMSKGEYNFAKIDAVIVKTLNQMTEKGYKIISVSNKTANSNIHITTYTMEKAN